MKPHVRQYVKWLLGCARCCHPATINHAAYLKSAWIMCGLSCDAADARYTRKWGRA